MVFEFVNEDLKTFIDRLLIRNQVMDLKLLKVSLFFVFTLKTSSKTSETINRKLNF